jgi:hypothetical protein
MSPARPIVVVLFAAAVLGAGPVLAQSTYKVLATNRTATMEQEMNRAAELGLRFGAVATRWSW